MQALLVGCLRRVKVHMEMVVLETAELAEVSPPYFERLGLLQHLGVRNLSTMDYLKAACKKSVLQLPSAPLLAQHLIQTTQTHRQQCNL